MTKQPPTDDGSKPASEVIALDSYRDPWAVRARESRESAERLRALCAKLGEKVPQTVPASKLPPLTDEQQAEIDARAAELRDRATWLPKFRAAWVPIAAALAEMAPTAARISAGLEAGDLSAEDLRAAVRIANAISNRADLGGESLFELTSEVWQYGSLLAGDFAVDEKGDVVDAVAL